MTEADLRDLGIHRIPVPVPFSHAGGPANVYVVEEAGGGLLLFDAGLGTPDAAAALAEGFRRIGRRFDEVDRIVVSHGHVDHYGAARAIQEWHGGELPVFAHPADIPKIAEEGWRWSDRLPVYAAYFERLGAPRAAMAETAREIGRGFEMARRIPGVRPVDLAAPIRAKYVTLEVHHMPGHTPGVICLHDRKHRLFFSADHLLEKVSPNPLIELGPDGQPGAYRPLVAYLESIGRLHALDVDRVLPGHGEPFGDHRKVVDALLGFMRKRQAKIRTALERGPLTGYEVSEALFPWAQPRDLFLTLSEALANLEVLEARGEVLRDVEGGRIRFRLAA